MFLGFIQAFSIFSVCCLKKLRMHSREWGWELVMKNLGEKLKFIAVL